MPQRPRKCLLPLLSKDHIVAENDHDSFSKKHVFSLQAFTSKEDFRLFAANWRITCNSYRLLTARAEQELRALEEADGDEPTGTKRKARAKNDTEVKRPKQGTIPALLFNHDCN